MGKQAICIVGKPAAGKSTLVRQLLRNRGVGRPFNSRSLHGVLKDGVAVLGKYTENGRFDGTDRLSATVIVDAERFLRDVAPAGRVHTVVWEGDRLTCRRMFEAAASGGYRLRVLFLRVSDELLRVRHRQRGDTQTEAWLAGRNTKIARLLGDYPPEFAPSNEDAVEASHNLAWLEDAIEEGSFDA